MRPRAWLASVLLTGTLTAAAAASPPTRVVVRNVGERATRVQVSLGVVMPCDSKENQMLFDEVLAAGATRTFTVDALLVCARNTTSDTTIDWRPSTLVSRRCRWHRCRHDPDAPIVFDAVPK